MADTKAAAGRVDAWQCIGCGKIEAPQPCIGVCRDRRAQLVYAEDYDALAAEAGRLRTLVHRIALVTPRPGEAERTYGAFQAQARDLLAELTSSS